MREITRTYRIFKNFEEIKIKKMDIFKLNK